MRRWAPLLAFPLAVLAAEVSVEGVFPPEVPAPRIQEELLHLAQEELLKAEMVSAGLDAGAYSQGWERKFPAWSKDMQERHKAAADPAPFPPPWKLRRALLDPESLLERHEVKSFGPLVPKPGAWGLTLEGTARAALLPAHHARFSAPGEGLSPRLYLSTRILPSNFSWKDLQLAGERDFAGPVESEWLKWWASALPEGVGEVLPCLGECAAALFRWQALPEGAPPAFEPVLAGHMLLSVELTLQRPEALAPGRMALTGGVLWHDFDSRRVLRWGDLSPEAMTAKTTDPKARNSALASWCYRAPLGKFLEMKNQARRSVSPVGLLVVRLENAAHMGQVLRLQEWLGAKGGPFRAQASLGSFSSRRGRVLVRYQGDGAKFKAMVSAPKELESEWGRPVAVTEEGGELVFTLAPLL